MKKSAIFISLLCFSAFLAFPQAIVRTQIETTPPGASIYVDGAEIGRTPMEFRFRDGRIYRVELKKNGFKTVTINYRGGSGNISRRLENNAPPPPPQKPSRPSQKMDSPSHERDNRHDNRRDNGRQYERDNRHDNRRDNGRQYERDNRHDNRRDNERQYERNDRHDNRKIREHQHRKYTLSIASDIRQAAVYINERFVGTAPLRLELERGDYNIQIISPGHRDYRERIHLERDKEIFARFR